MYLLVCRCEHWEICWLIGLCQCFMYKMSKSSCRQHHHKILMTVLVKQDHSLCPHQKRVRLASSHLKDHLLLWSQEMQERLEQNVLTVKKAFNFGGIFISNVRDARYLFTRDVLILVILWPMRDISVENASLQHVCSSPALSPAHKGKVRGIIFH